jgi:hypothetical protein
METFLFFVLELVTDAFKDNVGFFWLRNSHHLDINVIVSYDLREGKFAYFTFKFSEII